jgi:MoaA/NifB/PqqE/SkfB family radical SAM enzyme
MRAKNILKMGLGSLRCKIFKLRRPLNVMLAVTNRCTSHCLYCSIPERKKPEMTLSEIRDVLNQLQTSGVERLGIWGGEPLVRDEIGEIISYAKSKGFFVTLDTNGHLIPEKISQIRKVDHINIGFDGPEEIHDKLRGKGNFKKVIQAFKCLKENNIPFWTITVLTKYNINCIEEILNYAKKFGFKTTFQILHHNEFLSRNHDNLFPENEELKKCIEKLIYYKEQNEPVASSSSYLNYLLNWPDYRKPTLNRKFGKLDCLAGKLFCNIDVDGSLYPCSLLIEKIFAPNVLEMGFRKAFFSLPSPACKSCIASCYVEYNYLFGLNFKTIKEWLKALK